MWKIKTYHFSPLKERRWQQPSPRWARISCVVYLCSSWWPICTLAHCPALLRQWLTERPAAAAEQACAVQSGRRGTGGGAAAGGPRLKIRSATAPTTASVNGSRPGQDQRVFISFLTTWPPRQANASTLACNTFTTDVVQISSPVYTILVSRRDGSMKYSNSSLSTWSTFS